MSKYKGATAAHKLAFALTAASILLVGSCDNFTTGQSKDFPEPVDITMQTWIGYGYAVIANEKGYFGDMRVNMSTTEDGTALVGGLTGNTNEIIGSTLDQFVLQRSNNLPGRLLNLTDDSYGGDGMTVTDSIKTLSDVKGKRVAYTPGPSSEYVLATALKTVGLTLDDITPVTFPDPNGTVTAFINGDVDAAVIFQPFLEQTLSRPGSRFLFTTKEFPDISVGCFIIRDNLPNGDKVATRFIEGIKKAERFAHDHPAEADALLLRFFTKIDAKTLNTMKAGARLKSAADNVRFLSAKGGAEPPVLKLLRDIDEHYRSRNVAGPRRPSADDIEPAAAAAFQRQ